MKFLIILALAGISYAQYDCESDPLTTMFESSQSRCLEGLAPASKNLKGYDGLCTLHDLSMVHLRSFGGLNLYMSVRWNLIEKLYVDNNAAQVYSDCGGISPEEEGFFQSIKSFFGKVFPRNFSGLEENLDSLMACTKDALVAVCAAQEAENDVDVEPTEATEVQNPINDDPAAEVIPAYKSHSKYVKFAENSLEGKGVREVYGIGEKTAEKWANLEEPITRAFQLVTVLHKLKKNENDYVAWLKSVGAAASYAKKTYNNLMDYCANNPVECEGLKEPEMKPTSLLIHWTTVTGENLVIKGRKAGCTGEDCSINIELEPHEGWKEYKYWSQGANLLTEGPAPEQTVTDEDGILPKGIPLRWTSNDPNNLHYDPINTYEPHIWVLNMEMACEDTNDGWFEFSVGVQVGQEVTWNDEFPEQTCENMDPLNQPNLDTNPTDNGFGNNRRYARCGALNKFHHTCQIFPL